MLLDTLSTKAFTARRLAESGMLAPTRPDRLARVVRTLREWGPTMAGGYAVSAIRYPGATAIIDDHGELTFAEMHRRTNALAHAWREAGIGEDDMIAILCRNHRGFVEALVAASKLGAHALLLNTAFSSPQIASVCAGEDACAIVCDAEFAERVGAAARRRLRFVARTEPEPGAPRLAADRPTLEQLIDRGDPGELVPPRTRGRIVLLTSGTTGAPKGANRKEPQTLDPAAALLSKIPLRARGRTLISAPLFHSWGLAHLALASSRRADRCCRASSRRRSWTRSATSSPTSTARPRSRGRRSPRRRTCGLPRAPPGARRAGRSCVSTTPPARRSARGRRGASSSATSSSSPATRTAAAR